MRRFSKKTLAALVGAAVVIAGGGVAYAYWSAGGTGTGTATAGSNNAITINQTSTIAGLAPGSGPQTLSGDFDNGNSSPVYVTSVDAIVSGTDAVGCDATDFTITGPAVVGAEIPEGAGVGTWSGVTIEFNNKPGQNQDACKNATVDLAYTSN
jgi:hypothetical protein